MDTNINKYIIDNKLLNHTSTNKKQINNLSNNLSNNLNNNLNNDLNNDLNNNLNNNLNNKKEKKEESMYKIYFDYMVSRN